VVLINRSGDRSGFEARTNLIAEYLPESLPQYLAHVVVRGVRNVASGALVSLDEAVVVSAIAQPESFLTAVKAAGIHVRSHFAFPDHHHFILEEVETLSAHAPEVPLLCTSKDAVKLRSICPSRLHVLETSLEFDSEDSFFRALVAAIEKRRARVLQPSA
jgi:tetraacyldisaccharide 4'-kinase